MLKALFPISVDNQAFRTSLVLPALRPIVRRYNEVIFLIADRLQLYNKACAVDQGILLKVVLDSFQKGGYFPERRAWLQKLRKGLGAEKTRAKWTVVGIDDISDGVLYRILRNVVLLFHTTKTFRRDVEATAEEHWRGKERLVSPDVEQRLSEAYILEEIAINIRIRVLEEVGAEFYVGEYLSPLVDLYAGKYAVDVFTLAGVPKRQMLFEFFELVGDRRDNWQLRKPDRRSTS